MLRIADSRAQRHALRWTWPDMLRVGFLLWLIPIACLVLLDIRMGRVFLDGDRRAAALAASIGRPVRSFGKQTIIITAILHGSMIAMGLRGHYRAGSRRLQQRRRTRDQCIICGYPLAGIIPQPDGHRVCPECGAAWGPNLAS